MAIGAHELLLIIRAQNQAAGLLGRVARDMRRLQNMRDLDMQRSRIVNQLASNAIAQQQKMAKIQSVVSATGKARLANEKAMYAVYGRQLNISNRIDALEVRRTAIAKGEINLEVQRLRILQQQASVEATLEKIELRRQAVTVQAGKIGTQIMRNVGQQQALVRKQFSLETQLMERRLAAAKAAKAAEKDIASIRSEIGSMTAKGISGAPQQAARAGISAAEQRSLIAQRRVQETQMALNEIPLSRGVLSSSLSDLNKQIPQLAGRMEELAAAQKSAEATATALEEREKTLAVTAENLAARLQAVDAAEEELNIALKNTERELAIVRSAWMGAIQAAEGYAASLQIDIAQSKILNEQLAQTDALMAAQKGEKLAAGMQAVGHLGRVLSTAGLIGVAAFGAMGIAAAHFNTEVTRASTQTGNIFTANAQTIATGADKIGKSITDIMQTIPASSHDLAASFYYVYSTLNTTLGQGTKLVTLFSQAWLAGGMVGSVEDVSKALVTLANNWGISAKSGKAFTDLVKSTIATVRFGGFSLEQYTATLNQLAPAFKGAHQSIGELNGAIAFLSKMMPSQGQAATGLSRLIQQMQRLAAHPAPGFEQLSKDIQDSTGNLKPFSEVLATIIREHPEIVKSGVALQNFWKAATGTQGTQQAYKAFQAYILHFKDYQLTLKKTGTDQNDFNRDLKAMENSTGVKWDVFVSQMKALGLELGATVVPALLAATKPVAALAKWFNNLSDSQKKTIGEVLLGIAAFTLAAGIIATVVAAAAALYRNLKTLQEMFGLFRTKVAANSKSLELLASDTGSVTAKFGLWAGGITATLLILNHFGVSLGDIIHAMGGFKGILLGLSLLSFAKIAAKIATGLKLIQTETEIATTRVGRLRDSLIGLGSIVIPTILIPIAVKESKGITHPGPGQPGIKTSGGILGQIEKVALGGDVAVRKYIFGQTQKQAISGTIKDTRGSLFNFGGSIKYGAAPQSVLTQLAQISNSPWTTNTIMAQAMAAYGAGNYKAITDIWKVVVAGATKSQFTAASRAANFGRYALPTAGDTTQSQLSTKQFEAGIKQAYKLQQAVQQAPNLAAWYTAYNKFNAFFNKLTANLSKPMKKAAQDALSAMSNFPAPTKSLQAIITMARHVEELHKAALAAGDDISLWKKYWAALDQLNKTGTPDQISKANEFLQAQGDIAQYSTGKILQMAQALEKLREAAAAHPTDIALQTQFQKASDAYSTAATSQQQAIVQPTIDAQAAAAAARPIVPQATITNLVMQERAVQKAAEAAPTNVSGWARYYALVDKIAELSRGHQEDIANSIADAIGGVSKLTLRQAIAMSRQLIALQEIATKAPTIANWQKFFALQTKYGLEASQAIQTQADQVAQAQAAAADAAKQTAQASAQAQIDAANQARDQAISDARSQLQTAKSTLMDIFNTAKQQYQSFLGTIFSGPYEQSAYMQDRLRFGFHMRPTDILKDMQSSVKQAETFSGSLDQLRKRGAPQEMISQIAELGPAAQQQLESLLKLTPQQMKQYVTMFKKGQDEANKYAKTAMDNQIKQWLQFGKNVAQAIITGVTSQTPQLENAIAAVVKNLFPGLAAKAGQKTKAEGGGYPDASTTTTTPSRRGGGGMSGYTADPIMPANTYMDANTGKLITNSFRQSTRAFVPVSPDTLKILRWQSTHGYKPAPANILGQPIRHTQSATRSLQSATGDATRSLQWGKKINPADAKTIAGYYQHNKRWDKNLNAWVPIVDPSVNPRAAGPTRSLQGNTTIHNVTYNIHPTQKGEGLESMLRRSHFYYRNRKSNL